MSKIYVPQFVVFGTPQKPLEFEKVCDPTNWLPETIPPLENEA